MALVIGILDAADWDEARPEDIREVCLSAAHCFDPAIAEKPLEPIRVEPARSLFPPGPVTRFKRLETGQVAIEMAVRGRQWAQLAFQFAHEFCHVLANFRPPLVDPTKWIEESLCEVSSLFALRTMASTWRDAPPCRPWADYADALAQYANDRITDPTHGLPAGMTFPAWLAAALPLLERDPVRRADNHVIARHLLPLFEADPGAWRAVRYLNLWSTLEDLRFATYFNAWRSVTPPQHHAVVNRIEQRLTT